MTQPESKKTYRVFVSSTYMDNRDRRETVLDAVNRFDFSAITMEWWSADERPPEVVDREKLGDADLFLLIVAHRYGEIPPGQDLSYTELEFEAAVEGGKDILAFVIDPKSKIDPSTAYDPGEDWWIKQGKLQAFKRKVATGRIARPFTDARLGVLVVQALTEWRGRQGGSASESTPPTPRAQPDPSLTAYLKRIESEHESIALAGFETKIRVPIKLDDLYVPLRAVVDLRSSACGHFGSAEEAMEDAGMREARDDVALTEAFGCAEKYGDRRGLVILGDPGSGKTTQMKRMLLSVARNGPHELGLPDGMIPVLLPLRNLEDTTEGFPAIVERELQSPHYDLSKGFGEELLKRGNLLFLLDGLDEIKADRRRDVARWIESAARRRKDCRFVVTCRYAGYADDAQLDEQFLELHLKPLETDQAEEFIRRWFSIVETSLASDKAAAERKASDEATELIEHLREPDIRATRVFAMTRNPLLLTAICLVHRDRGRLPRRRVDLYEECVNVLLERWREAKKLDVSLDARSARQVLQPVAWFLHQEQNRTRATAEELTPTLEPVLASVRWGGGTPESFLATIRDESGLLTGWSGESYGFMHLGFQEYLAARQLLRLCNQSEAERTRLMRQLAGEFGQSWWREVTLLFLATEDAPFGAFFGEVVNGADLLTEEDLLNACADEASTFSPGPFLSLLDVEPGRDQVLWDRQLAAARLLRRVAPKAVEPIAKQLARHPHPELAMLFGGAAAPVSTRTNAGIELVTIPGGTFLMGADPKLEAKDNAWIRDHSKPLREVAVPSFQLGKYPVTNAQYGEFMKAAGHGEPGEWGNSKFNQPEQPVVAVSWDDAVAFCEWAGLRLPSEAEWEYACRGQQDGLNAARTRYWSGNDEEDLARVAWYDKNSGGATKPVGGKPANPFGLHEMHGNVWEWCSDRWHDNYEGAPDDGSSWDEGPSEHRVMRGGSFESTAMGARSAYRSLNRASSRGNDRGFRVASPSPPSDPHPFTT